MAEVRRDLQRPKMTPEHIACNVVLQLHAGMDPDTARGLSDRIVRQVQRARDRGHAHSFVTGEEAHRAKAELHRRGHDVPLDVVTAAMNHALIRGWGE